MCNFEQKQILPLLTEILVDYFKKCLDNPTLDLFRIYLAIEISKVPVRKSLIKKLILIGSLPKPNQVFENINMCLKLQASAVSRFCQMALIMTNGQI